MYISTLLFSMFFTLYGNLIPCVFCQIYRQVLMYFVCNYVSIANQCFLTEIFFSVTLRGRWKNSERTSFPVNVASICPTWKEWLLCWARSPKRLESLKVGVPPSTISYIVSYTSIVIQSTVLFAADFIYLWKASNFRSLYVVVIFTLKHKIQPLFPHLQLPVFLLEDLCIYLVNRMFDIKICEKIIIALNHFILGYSWN